MSENKEIIQNELSEEDTNKIFGGMAFKVNCSCCGKTIHYPTHPWGRETKGTAVFCKGYFCNECVQKFNGGEITDESLLSKFNQLHNK